MRKGWEIKKLEEVCEFTRGLTYSKKDEVDFSSNIVLRSTNVDLVTSSLDFEELKYISDNIVIPENKKVTKGALIICTANGSKNHLGKVALIDDDYDYAFGGFMGLLKPKKEITSKYFFYSMISEAYKKFISELSDGANINNLRFDDLAKYEIPVPSIIEQKQITSILDEVFSGIDQAKGNLQRNLQNAKDLLQSKKNQVFENLAKTEGKVPITTVCNEIFAGGDAPKENFSDEKTEKYSIPIFANAVGKQGLYGFTDVSRVTEPSITIAGRGSGTGYTEVRYEPFFPIVRLIVLTPNTSKISLEFLKYAIQSLTLLKSGSAIPQLTIPMIKGYSLPLPSLSNQEIIVEQLDTLSTETKNLENIYLQKLKGLEELKKSILQKAFSGELIEKKTEVTA
jgi:type I restriction enzyme, S subunit